MNTVIEEVETTVENLIESLLAPTKNIVVYNDDVNTFEHVILCLIKYCRHSLEQAEQCTHIIHNNGKYAVKSGDYEKLKPIYEALLENGILAKIE
jgi:ATP-dependent Clp protease adaptor protein ClpS